MNCLNIWTKVRKGAITSEELPPLLDFQTAYIDPVTNGWAVTLFDGEHWLNICTSHLDMSLQDKDCNLKVSKIDFWTVKELDRWLEKEYREWEGEEEEEY